MKRYEVSCDLSVDEFSESGKLLATWCEILGIKSEEELERDAKVIAAAPEMYELVRELGNLPDEQCMIGPMIKTAREILRRIDG